MTTDRSFERANTKNPGASRGLYVEFNQDQLSRKLRSLRLRDRWLISGSALRAVRGLKASAQLSRKERSLRDRLGCFSFLKAFASI